MALVDLSLLKAHVRADDFTEDDEYLSSVLESAESWVVQATARTESALLGLGGGVLPSQLRQAVLLLAGHWYNQREAVGSSSLAEVPYTVQALVRPFRLLASDSDQSSGSGDTGSASDTEILEAIAKVQAAVEGVSKEVSETVATDIAEVRTAVTEVQADVAGVKTDVAGVKEDVASVKDDVVAVKASTEGLGDRIDGAENAVETAIGAAVTDIANAVSASEKSIADTLTGLQTAFETDITAGVKEIADALQDDYAEASETLAAIAKDTGGFVQTISDGVSEVKTAISDGVSEVKTAINDSGSAVSDAIAEVQTTADEIKAAIEDMPTVTEMTAEKTAEIINEENGEG